MEERKKTKGKSTIFIKFYVDFARYAFFSYSVSILNHSLTPINPNQNIYNYIINENYKESDKKVFIFLSDLTSY